jgi:hypothetical protein
MIAMLCGDAKMAYDLLSSLAFATIAALAYLLWAWVRSPSDDDISIAALIVIGGLSVGFIGVF